MRNQYVDRYEARNFLTNEEDELLVEMFLIDSFLDEEINDDTKKALIVAYELGLTHGAGDAKEIIRKIFKTFCI